MMEARLPAHLEVAGLIRRVEAAGGFGMVLNKGERDAGTILVVLMEKGENSRLYERMPNMDGSRKWSCTKVQDPENKHEFMEYLDRRRTQDCDTWLVELDIQDGERFIDAG